MEDALVVVSKIYRIHANVAGHAYELGQDGDVIVSALPPELGRSAAAVLEAVKRRFGAAWAYYASDDVGPDELLTAAQLVLQHTDEKHTGTKVTADKHKGKKFSFPFKLRKNKSSSPPEEDGDLEGDLGEEEVTQAAEDLIQVAELVAEEAAVRRSRSSEEFRAAAVGNPPDDVTDVTVDELLAAAESVIDRATLSPLMQRRRLRSNSDAEGGGVGPPPERSVSVQDLLRATEHVLPGAVTSASAEDILSETERVIEQALVRDGEVKVREGQQKVISNSENEKDTKADQWKTKSKESKTRFRTKKNGAKQNGVYADDAVHDAGKKRIPAAANMHDGGHAMHPAGTDRMTEGCQLNTNTRDSQPDTADRESSPGVTSDEHKENSPELLADDVVRATDNLLQSFVASPAPPPLFLLGQEHDPFTERTANQQPASNGFYDDTYRDFAMAADLAYNMPIYSSPYGAEGGPRYEEDLEELTPEQYAAMTSEDLCDVISLEDAAALGEAQVLQEVLQLERDDVTGEHDVAALACDVTAQLQEGAEDMISVLAREQDDVTGQGDVTRTKRSSDYFTDVTEEMHSDVTSVTSDVTSEGGKRRRLSAHLSDYFTELESKHSSLHSVLDDVISNDDVTSHAADDADSSSSIDSEFEIVPPHYVRAAELGHERDDTTPTPTPGDDVTGPRAGAVRVSELDVDDMLAADVIEIIVTDSQLSPLSGDKVTHNEAKVTPDGDKVTPDGDKVTPDGDKVTPDGDKVTPDGDKVTPDGDKVTPDGDKVTPDGDKVTSENVLDDDTAQNDRSERSTRSDDVTESRGWQESGQGGGVVFEDGVTAEIVRLYDSDELLGCASDVTQAAPNTLSLREELAGAAAEDYNGSDEAGEVVREKLEMPDEDYTRPGLTPVTSDVFDEPETVETLENMAVSLPNVDFTQRDVTPPDRSSPKSSDDDVIRPLQIDNEAVRRHLSHYMLRVGLARSETEATAQVRDWRSRGWRPRGGLTVSQDDDVIYLRGCARSREKERRRISAPHELLSGFIRVNSDDEVVPAEVTGVKVTLPHREVKVTRGQCVTRTVKSTSDIESNNEISTSTEARAVNTEKSLRLKETMAAIPAKVIRSKVTTEETAQAQEVTPVEVTPVKVKPAEVKTAEGRPAEVKPVEVKTAEGKPAEVKPVEVKTAEGKPAEVKPVEVKAAEGKSVDVKPVEVKPAKVKPAEVKPAEVKPAEVKPAEVKAAEVKPAEVKPAEIKPVEVTPVKVKQAEVKTAEGKPAEVKPVEVKPAEVKPAEVKPAEVKLAEVKPAEVKPAEVKAAEVTTGKVAASKVRSVEVTQTVVKSSEAMPLTEVTPTEVVMDNVTESKEVTKKKSKNQSRTRKPKPWKQNKTGVTAGEDGGDVEARTVTSDISTETEVIEEKAELENSEKRASVVTEKLGETAAGAASKHVCDASQTPEDAAHKTLDFDIANSSSHGTVDTAEELVTVSSEDTSSRSAITSSASSFGQRSWADIVAETEAAEASSAAAVTSPAKPPGAALARRAFSDLSRNAGDSRRPKEYAANNGGHTDSKGRRGDDVNDQGTKRLPSRIARKKNSRSGNGKSCPPREASDPQHGGRNNGRGTRSRTYSDKSSGSRSANGRGSDSSGRSATKQHQSTSRPADSSNAKPSGREAGNKSTNESTACTNEAKAKPVSPPPPPLPPVVPQDTAQKPSEPVNHPKILAGKKARTAQAATSEPTEYEGTGEDDVFKAIETMATTPASKWAKRRRPRPNRRHRGTNGRAADGEEAVEGEGNGAERHGSKGQDADRPQGDRDTPQRALSGSSQVESEGNPATPEVKQHSTEVRQPEPEVRQPELDGRQSESEVRQFEPEVRQFEPEVRQSEPEVRQSEAEVRQPEPEVRHPEPAVQRSEAEHLETKQKIDIAPRDVEITAAKDESAQEINTADHHQTESLTVHSKVTIASETSKSDAESSPTRPDVSSSESVLQSDTDLGMTSSPSGGDSSLTSLEATDQDHVTSQAHVRSQDKVTATESISQMHMSNPDMEDIRRHLVEERRHVTSAQDDDVTSAALDQLQQDLLRAQDLKNLLDDMTEVRVKVTNPSVVDTTVTQVKVTDEAKVVDAEVTGNVPHADTAFDAMMGKETIEVDNRNDVEADDVTAVTDDVTAARDDEIELHSVDEVYSSLKVTERFSTDLSAGAEVKVNEGDVQEEEGDFEGYMRSRARNVVVGAVLGAIERDRRHDNEEVAIDNEYSDNLDVVEGHDDVRLDDLLPAECHTMSEERLTETNQSEGGRQTASQSDVKVREMTFGLRKYTSTDSLERLVDESPSAGGGRQDGVVDESITSEEGGQDAAELKSSVEFSSQDAEDCYESFVILSHRQDAASSKEDDPALQSSDVTSAEGSASDATMYDESLIKYKAPTSERFPLFQKIVDIDIGEGQSEKLGTPIGVTPICVQPIDLEAVCDVTADAIVLLEDAQADATVCNVTGEESDLTEGQMQTLQVPLEVKPTDVEQINVDSIGKIQACNYDTSACTHIDDVTGTCGTSRPAVYRRGEVTLLPTTCSDVAETVLCRAEMPRPVDVVSDVPDLDLLTAEVGHVVVNNVTQQDVVVTEDSSICDVRERDTAVCDVTNEHIQLADVTEEDLALVEDTLDTPVCDVTEEDLALVEDTLDTPVCDVTEEDIALVEDTLDTPVCDVTEEDIALVEDTLDTFALLEEEIKAFSDDTHIMPMDEYLPVSQKIFESEVSVSENNEEDVPLARDVSDTIYEVEECPVTDVSEFTDTKEASFEGFAHEVTSEGQGQDKKSDARNVLNTILTSAMSKEIALLSQLEVGSVTSAESRDVTEPADNDVIGDLLSQIDSVCNDAIKLHGDDVTQEMEMPHIEPVCDDVTQEMEMPRIEPVCDDVTQEMDMARIEPVCDDVTQEMEMPRIEPVCDDVTQEMEMPRIEPVCDDVTQEMDMARIEPVCDDVTQEMEMPRIEPVCDDVTQEMDMARIEPVCDDVTQEMEMPRIEPVCDDVTQEMDMARIEPGCDDVTQEMEMPRIEPACDDVTQEMEMPRIEPVCDDVTQEMEMPHIESVCDDVTQEQEMPCDDVTPAEEGAGDCDADERSVPLRHRDDVTKARQTHTDDVKQEHRLSLSERLAKRIYELTSDIVTIQTERERREGQEEVSAVGEQKVAEGHTIKVTAGRCSQEKNPVKTDNTAGTDKFKARSPQKEDTRNDVKREIQTDAKQQIEKLVGEEEVFAKLQIRSERTSRMMKEATLENRMQTIEASNEKAICREPNTSHPHTDNTRKPDSDITSRSQSNTSHRREADRSDDDVTDPAFRNTPVQPCSESDVSAQRGRPPRRARLICGTSDEDVRRALASLRDSSLTRDVRRRCLSPLSMLHCTPRDVTLRRRRHSWGALPLSLPASPLTLTLTREIDIDSPAPRPILSRSDVTLHAPRPQRSRSLPKSPKSVRFSPVVDHRPFQVDDGDDGDYAELVATETTPPVGKPPRKSLPADDVTAGQHVMECAQHGVDVGPEKPPNKPVGDRGGKRTSSPAKFASDLRAKLPGQRAESPASPVRPHRGNVAVVAVTSADPEKNVARKLQSQHARHPLSEDSATSRDSAPVNLGQEKSHLTVTRAQAPALTIAPPGAVAQEHTKQVRPVPAPRTHNKPVIPPRKNIVPPPPATQISPPLQSIPVRRSVAMTRENSDDRIDPRHGNETQPHTDHNTHQSSHQNDDRFLPMRLSPPPKPPRVAMPTQTTSVLKPRVAMGTEAPRLPPPPRHAKSRGRAARRAAVMESHFGGGQTRPLEVLTAGSDPRTAQPALLGRYGAVTSPIATTVTRMRTERDVTTDRCLEQEPLLGDFETASMSSVTSSEDLGEPPSVTSSGMTSPGSGVWAQIQQGVTDVLRGLGEITPASSLESLSSEVKVSPDDVRATLEHVAQGPCLLGPAHAQTLSILLTCADQELLLTALREVANAAAFTANQDLLRRADALPRLCRLLRVHSMALHAGHVAFPAVVSGAATAVSNLAVNQENQTELQECIPTLVDFAVSDAAPESVQLATLQALTNLSLSPDNHTPYTRVIQSLYEYLDTRNAVIQLQALKVLVNLSTNLDMVPHLLAAKYILVAMATVLQAPGCLLDLLSVKVTPEDLVLRWTTFLANVMTTVRSRGIGVTSLPTEYKAASPETTYTALYGLHGNVDIRSRVFVLCKHACADIRQQATRIYACLV